MNSEQILALVMKRRAGAGLGLTVHGVEGYPVDMPFTCYAKDDEQRDRWTASFEAKGCRVEVMAA